MNLFRFDILSLAISAVSTYRLRKISVAAVTQIGRPVSLKLIVTAVDFNAETTFRAV